MARERLIDLLAGLDVPQPRRIVIRRGDDALAVGAECRAQHGIRMARERLADLIAGFGVPQPCRTMRLPSGLNAALFNVLPWPLRMSLSRKSRHAPTSWNSASGT